MDPVRHLSEHIVEGDSVNHQVVITVLDAPGSGGSNHRYSIRWKNERDQTEPHTFIGFQDGPIAENGVNGITNEALLAVVADRLRGFQSGPFACDANEQALMAVQSAIYHLQTRTRERIKRGVEGTLAK